MKPGDLPPIEPLSPEAWARIEHGVFARLEREATPPPRVPRFAAVAAAAGAFAAAAALALWLRGAAEPAASPAPGASASAASAPAATVATIETRPTPALDPAPSAPRRVESGARLHTADVAERLQIGDSEVVLAASSELAVQGSDQRGWLLELVSGRVDCQIAPRAARPDFVTRAGEVEVRVVGTRFSVEHDAGQGTRVNVQEGKVRVSERGQSVLLGAGERWSGFEPPAPRAPSARAKRAAAAERERLSFERATRLESSEPATALRIYGELSARPGPWAANALYAAGRLELERGNDERARTLLRRYLKRYPAGANVRDAEALLAR